ncbi:hypothetical protein OPS25_01440 [Alteromonas ponticola]|uniref:Uncharacterized protein n=1 Tax=Alteromonas aquimaris TaxID=2998417 RepID=A0ABT3P320_9ALTE|nr:hypothetical protein [Alteromonas aquimaris]MCW8107166.1 hypothetical protein [Alteromonas aquimaris]
MNVSIKNVTLLFAYVLALTAVLIMILSIVTEVFPTQNEALRNVIIAVVIYLTVKLATHFGIRHNLFHDVKK